MLKIRIFAARYAKEIHEEEITIFRGADCLDPEGAGNGVPVPKLFRTHGMGSAAFDQWRSKFGDMEASMISEMMQLQAENARRKRMYADIAMQNELDKEALAKK